jgi:hypothetical protein
MTTRTTTTKNFSRGKHPTFVSNDSNLLQQSKQHWLPVTGRKGHVSNTNLGGDWVLAESEQVAACLPFRWSSTAVERKDGAGIPKVVPNLVVFDASGIAGSMAGKGTLWLASFFEQRRTSSLKLLDSNRLAYFYTLYAFDQVWPGSMWWQRSSTDSWLLSNWAGMRTW